MSTAVTPPMEVTDNTLVGQLTTLARYILTSFGSYALGKGWIDDELLQLLVGLTAVVVPTAYGVYKSYTNKTRLIIAADAAPDNIAKVI